MTVTATWTQEDIVRLVTERDEYRQMYNREHAINESCRINEAAAISRADELRAALQKLSKQKVADGAVTDDDLRALIDEQKKIIYTLNQKNERGRDLLERMIENYDPESGCVCDRCRLHPEVRAFLRDWIDEAKGTG